MADFKNVEKNLQFPKKEIYIFNFLLKSRI